MTKKVVIFFVAVLVAVTAFSKEQTTVRTFMPATSTVDDFEVLIQKEISNIKQSDSYDYFLAFSALRNDDLSICKSDTCREYLTEDLAYLRYQNEGGCNKITNRDLSNTCSAIKSGNCSSLTGWRASYCKAFLDEDVNLLTKIRNQHGGKGDVKSRVLFNLGIYKGFKHYSPVACERFISQISFKSPDTLLFEQFACQILFSFDEKSAIENSLRDLAVAHLSYVKKDTTLCSRIKYPRLKTACEKSSVKNFDEYWRSDLTK